MKHLWVLEENTWKLICAVCGMDKEEWKRIGKPPCREKLPIPPEEQYPNYNYL